MLHRPGEVVWHVACGDGVGCAACCHAIVLETGVLLASECATQCATQPIGSHMVSVINPR